jgi:hypothetical protein
MRNPIRPRGKNYCSQLGRWLNNRTRPVQGHSATPLNGTRAVIETKPPPLRKILFRTASKFMRRSLFPFRGNFTRPQKK